MIRIRRISAGLPVLRKYEIEFAPNSTTEPTEAITLRRGSAVRRLERDLGTGDAWSFVDAADRAWDAGDSHGQSSINPRITPSRTWILNFDVRASLAAPYLRTARDGSSIQASGERDGTCKSRVLAESRLVSMDVEALKKELDRLQIDCSGVSICDGEVEDRICLTEEDCVWHVFFNERGLRQGEERFARSTRWPLACTRLTVWGLNRGGPRDRNSGNPMRSTTQTARTRSSAATRSTSARLSTRAWFAEVIGGTFSARGGTSTTDRRGMWALTRTADSLGLLRSLDGGVPVLPPVLHD